MPGSQNTVTVTVTDERGASGIHVLVITVLPPANHPPVASPTATPNSGTAPPTVQFAANASDADSDPLTCAWDFGDPTRVVDLRRLPRLATARLVPRPVRLRPVVLFGSHAC